jgi:hypothetical protein
MASPTKVCTKCQERKPITDYHNSKRSKDGLFWHCKICCRKRHTDWAENNREHMKEYRQNWNDQNPEYGRRYTLQKYDLTVDQYNNMLTEQVGVCKICGQPETSVSRGALRSLSVDHCHDTGKVRGLLCYRCNTSIGRMNDDPDLLQKAVDYLTASHPPDIIEP